jgi:hypothetical protein
MDKPFLSKQAFWDIDMEKIDYQKNARHVVEKVIERGTEEDFINVLNYYGFKKVKELSLQAFGSQISASIFAALYSRLTPPTLNVTKRNSPTSNTGASKKNRFIA